jgi:hypothetical protein
VVGEAVGRGDADGDAVGPGEALVLAPADGDVPTLVPAEGDVPTLVPAEGEASADGDPQPAPAFDRMPVILTWALFCHTAAAIPRPLYVPATVCVVTTEPLYAIVTWPPAEIDTRRAASPVTRTLPATGRPALGSIFHCVPDRATRTLLLPVRSRKPALKSVPVSPDTVALAHWSAEQLGPRLGPVTQVQFVVGANVLVSAAASC